jgi:hypothetical protein
MRRVVCVIALMALAACQYPASRTEQGAAPGQIYFTGVPPTATVIIDGQNMGSAGSFDVKHVLAIAPGAHRVALMADSGPVLDKKYYIGSGSTVEVHP